MSIDLMNRVWWREDFDDVVAPVLQKHPGSGRNLKWVLLAMADNASDDGFCWPAVETIQRKTSLGRRAVQHALAQAEAVGLMRRRFRRDASTQYVLNLDMLPHVDRPRRSKERGPIDHFEEEPELFGTGAPHAPVGEEPAHATTPTRARHTVTRARGAPRTINEPSVEPSDSTSVGATDGKLTDELIAIMYLEMWNELTEDATALKPIQAFGGEKRKHLMQRIGEHAPSHTRDAVHAFFAELLGRIRGSTWLRGEGDKGWVMLADWPAKRSNCDKIMEGFYVQDHGVDGRRTSRDRSHVAAGQAARDILHAGGGAPRRSARELAGLSGAGASRAG